MRSRSLVSTSNMTLASCADAKGEGDTHVERCFGLHVCTLQRCCHSMLCFEVGDGFDVLVQVHVASAEFPVRSALPRPVAHLLCNRQVLRVVVDGLAEVPLQLIRVGSAITNMYAPLGLAGDHVSMKFKTPKSKAQQLRPKVQSPGAQKLRCTGAGKMVHKRCEHNREKRKCKQCGGASICLHSHVKRMCKDCGGAGICEHD